MEKIRARSVVLTFIPLLRRSKQTSCRPNKKNCPLLQLSCTFVHSPFSWEKVSIRSLTQEHRIWQTRALVSVEAAHLTKQVPDFEAVLHQSGWGSPSIHDDTSISVEIILFLGPVLHRVRAHDSSYTSRTHTRDCGHTRWRFVRGHKGESWQCFAPQTTHKAYINNWWRIT